MQNGDENMDTKMIKENAALVEWVRLHVRRIQTRLKEEIATLKEEIDRQHQFNGTVLGHQAWKIENLEAKIATLKEENATLKMELSDAEQGEATLLKKLEEVQ